MTKDASNNFYIRKLLISFDQFECLIQFCLVKAIQLPVSNRARRKFFQEKQAASSVLEDRWIFYENTYKVSPALLSTKKKFLSQVTTFVLLGKADQEVGIS